MLLLSPVPMVRGFGLLLVAGIALALGAALTLGVAALSARPARRGPRRARSRARLAPAWRGAGEILGNNRPARGVRTPRHRGWRRGALRAAPSGGRGACSSWPLVVAVVGLGPGHADACRVRHHEARPAEPPGAADLQALQKSTGVGGEIDVSSPADSVTDPAVVAG